MKTYKPIATLMMLIFLSIINIFLSVNLHCLLENQMLYPMPVAIADVINLFQLVFQSKAKLFFAIFEILIVVFLIYILYIQKVNGLNTYTRKITPDIETPTAMGKGEYGTARWLSKEKYKYHFGYAKLPTVSKINSLLHSENKGGNQY